MSDWDKRETCVLVSCDLEGLRQTALCSTNWERGGIFIVLSCLAQHNDCYQCSVFMMQCVFV